MITLTSGREVNIDLSLITMREFRSLFEVDSTTEDSDRLLARCAGLTLDELIDLPYPDYRRVFAEFLERARNPLSDPNSPGGSTKP